jgi:hypothetical protein
MNFAICFSISSVSIVNVFQNLALEGYNPLASLLQSFTLSVNKYSYDGEYNQPVIMNHNLQSKSSETIRFHHDLAYSTQISHVNSICFLEDRDI